jgi:hypothetical protein
VRALDSPEVFMSPLSYAVAPFTANKDRRRLQVDLDAPKIVKPGETLRIGHRCAEKSRIVVFAVDEGKATPVRPQAGVVLDESSLLHIEVVGDRADLLLRHPDESGPAAAGRATLVEIGGRHGGK